MVSSVRSLFVHPVLDGRARERVRRRRGVRRVRSRGVGGARWRAGGRAFACAEHGQRARAEHAGARARGSGQARGSAARVLWLGCVRERFAAGVSSRMSIGRRFGRCLGSSPTYAARDIRMSLRSQRFGLGCSGARSARRFAAIAVMAGPRSQPRTHSTSQHAPRGTPQVVSFRTCSEIRSLQKHRFPSCPECSCLRARIDAAEFDRKSAFADSHRTGSAGAGH